VQQHEQPADIQPNTTHSGTPLSETFESSRLQTFGKTSSSAFPGQSTVKRKSGGPQAASNTRLRLEAEPDPPREPTWKFSSVGAYESFSQDQPIISLRVSRDLASMAASPLRPVAGSQDFDWLMQEVEKNPALLSDSNISTAGGQYRPQSYDDDSEEALPHQPPPFRRRQRGYPDAPHRAYPLNPNEHALLSEASQAVIHTDGVDRGLLDRGALSQLQKKPVGRCPTCKELFHSWKAFALHCRPFPRTARQPRVRDRGSHSGHSGQPRLTKVPKSTNNRLSDIARDQWYEQGRNRAYFYFITKSR